MKIYLSLLLVLFALLPVSANELQVKNSVTTFDPKKLLYGVDFGFALSKSSWALSGSPQIGYKLADRFHVGAGIGYRYQRTKKTFYSYLPTESDNQLGEDLVYRYTEKSVSVNLFAHYYPWKKLIVSIKPEIMHSWYREKVDTELFKANKFIPAVTVGGGVHLKPVILQLNYELIQSKYSPYSDNIFFSVGFLF